LTATTAAVAARWAATLLRKVRPVESIAFMVCCQNMHLRSVLDHSSSWIAWYCCNVAGHGQLVHVMSGVHCAAEWRWTVL
jgi:hypothetical protein